MDYSERKNVPCYLRVRQSTKTTLVVHVYECSRKIRIFIPSHQYLLAPALTVGKFDRYQVINRSYRLWAVTQQCLMTIYLLGITYCFIILFYFFM